MSRILAVTVARAVIAAGSLASLAAPAAQAQCSIFREGVPDFDQKRAALPNTGNMYCVPTAATNLLGYISNNGIPAVLGGPFNWQLQQYYDYVSGQIDYLGDEMGTDANSGTTAKSGRNAIADLLNDRAPGRFTVSTYHGYVRLPDLYNFMTDSRLILLCYGYYKPDGSGEYKRDGGHCVTLTGMLDICNTNAPRLRLRDPADDSDDATQSTFRSRVSRGSLRNLPTSDGTITRWELIDLTGLSTTRRLIDTHITIRSRFAIWPSPFNGSWIRYDRVNSVTAQGGGTQTVFPTPNGQPIEQGELSPTGEVFFYTTLVGGSPDAVPPIYRQNTVTGETTFLGTLDRFTPLATDRFGDLYMVRGGAIRRYDASGASMVQLATFTPPGGLMPDALRWDDKRDLLFALGGTAGMQLLNRNLTGAGSYTLPAGVVLNGTGRFDITPGGTFFIGSANSGTIYHVRFNNVLPRLDLAQTIALPGVTGVKSIQVTETGTGLLCVMTSSGMREYVRNPTTGLWESAATPLFGDVPASNTMVLSKGRSNFVLGVHDTPEWNNVIVPETAPQISDCPADVNLDGMSTVDDLFIYINWWFSAVRTADFNVSGTVSIDDLFLYLNAWFVGC